MLTEFFCIGMWPVRDPKRRNRDGIENATLAIFNESKRDRASALAVGLPDPGDSAVGSASQCDQWIVSYMSIWI